MKILLHICCSVCASCCVERLRQQGHQVYGYFYNPNIQPQEEYLVRLKETKNLARIQNFPLIVGDYDVDNWFARIKGLEGEPEKGKRCKVCFAMRLKTAAKIAKDRSFDAFSTTLTISPHKDSQVINEIGQNVGEGLFLIRDFKKQNGFKRAQQLASQFHLYRQNYCGCIYSIRAHSVEG